MTVNGSNLLRQTNLGSFQWTRPLTILGFSLTLATALMVFAWATQPNRRAKITEIIGAPNPKGILIDSKPSASVNAVVTGQQVITTTTRISLQQADGGVARLSNQSALTLEKECLQLGEGELLIAGTQGCVGVIGVNTTNGIYILERIGSLGEIKVLSGQVEVSVPTNPMIQSFSLQPSQKVTFSLTGDEIGPIRLMLPMEVDEILKGPLFQGFQRILPNQDTLPGLPTAIAAAPAPRQTPPPTPAPPAAPRQIPAATPTKQGHPLSLPGRAVYAPPQPDDAAQDNYSPQSSPRSLRRPWFDVNSDRPTYRRKGWRSPYSSGSYRRRSPLYSKPSYSEPSYSKPPRLTQPAPAVEGSHPVPEAPSAPPPTSPELPPLPNVAEPSTEVPQPIGPGSSKDGI